MNRKQMVGSLLYTLQGSGQLEPGSKIMHVGLNKHNPVQALWELQDNEEIMSVALHEMTHFYSLQNSLGHVLGFLGYMAQAGVDMLHKRLQSGARIEQDDLQCYLYFRRQYNLRLEIWRPLLEGLAVYIQTCRPCLHGDELVTPLNTLIHFAATLFFLAPPKWPDTTAVSLNNLIDEFTGGILSAAYRTMIKGPSMLVEDSSLADALELNTAAGWLPYFLGHAYVRALQDRLMQFSSEFETPEIFLSLLLRILRYSSARLLESDTRWDIPDAIDRIYNWIELIERTPSARLKEIKQLEHNVDVLWFLETGECQAGFEPGEISAARSVSRLVPEPWGMFKKYVSHIDFDRLRERIRVELRREPSLHLEEEAAETVIEGWLRCTGSLNLSSNGICTICGWIPNYFHGRHAVALRMENSTWWLSLDNTEVKAVLDDPEAIPRLPTESFQPIGAPELPSTNLTLGVNSYMAYTNYRLPRRTSYEENTGYPTCLFQFNHPSDAEPLLLTVATKNPVASGPSRQVLQPVPERTAQILHYTGERMRENVASAFSISLPNLATFFAADGKEQLAGLIQTMMSREQLTLSRQRELWARRILTGLLGPRVLNRAKRQIITERMNVVLPQSPELRKLLAATYSAPSQLQDPGSNDWMLLLETLNEEATSIIGKPIFHLEHSIGSVRYLGLWGQSP